MKTVNETIKEIFALTASRLGGVRRVAMTLLVMLLTTLTAVAANTEEPRYNIDYVKSGTGWIFTKGWSVDKTYPDWEIGVGVAIYKDEACTDMIIRWAGDNVYRADVNAQYGITGNHGFDFKIPISGIPYDYPEGVYEHTFYLKFTVTNRSGERFAMNETPIAVTVRKLLGSGEADNPYLICNAGDWDSLADDMADDGIGDFYTDKYYELVNETWAVYDNMTAVTKMWGTNARPFAGNFNGNGKTLNVNIINNNITDGFAAPFSYVNGASIHDLTVAGSVSGMYYAGGIVAFASGTLNLQNCVCSAAISGFNIFAGGLIGCCNDLTLNMQNCLFLGSFSTTATGAKYHPIALKTPSATVTATVSDAYYIYTASPSAGLGNNSIAGAEGAPVNTARVPGEWTNKFVAADGNTYYLACIPPVGSLEDFKGVVTHIYVSGWAYDPNFPSAPIEVEAHVYSDEACANEVKSVRLTTDILRTDVNKTHRLTGTHGFDAHIPVDEEGTYYVKLFVIDSEDGDMQLGETMAVTVASNTPMLYSDYTATNYHTGSLSTAGTFVNLVDNDKSTEWITCLDDRSGTVYVDFRSATAFVPTGYVMSSLSQNTPVSWVIKATRNLEDEWTTITTVNDQEWQDYFGDFEFTIDNVTEPYRHYRFEVTAAERNGAFIQVAELQLKGYPNGAQMGHSPVSGLDRFEALSDRILIEGWAYDPDVPSEQVDVRIYVYKDEACTQELKRISMWTNHSRPDVNAAQGITGNHGFHTFIPISDAGTYYVKLMALDITGDEDRQIGNTQTITITHEPRSFVKDITFVQDVFDYRTDNRDKYRAMGWSETNHIVSNIFLFYNYESSNGLNNFYITDFYLSDAPNPVPDEITHNGRTYHLTPCYPSDSNMGKQKGDINALVGSGTHHLYYTRDTFDDNRALVGITVNNDPNGALGANGGTLAENLGLPGNPKYIHITTAPAYQAFTMKTPYSYSFERPLDEDGWKIIGIDGVIQSNGWIQDDCFHTFNDVYLISPMFDTDAPMKVEFNIQGNGNNTFYFGYSKATNDLSEFMWEGGQTTQNWQHFEYEAPIGTKYIAIHFPSGSNNIDDFIVTTYYNIAPKDYTVIEQNPLNATLAWTAPETSATVLGYKYQYKKWGDENWSDEQLVSDPTVTISGLSHDTPYDFRVCAIYEDGSFSKYLNGGFRTTPLPQPVQLYLTDLTDQTATISWSAPASEIIPTGYTYQFMKAGDSDWTAETKVGTTTTMTSFSGMTANTGCQFRVKAHYTEGDSPYTTFNFSTPDVWTLPFECSFENGLKGLVMINPFTYYTGISNLDNSRPEVQLDGDHAFLFHTNMGGSPQYLMSQLLPQDVVKKLTFYYRTFGMGFPERFQVGYSTTSNDPATFIWDDEIVTYEFEHYTKYNKTLPKDTRYVAVKFISNDQRGIYIDNLSIEVYSDKAAPTNLVATDLVDELATRITWSAPNASFTYYAYQYKKAVEDTWSDLTPTTVTTVTLDGLAVNTDYQFRVQARYADGSSSNFETVFFESDGGIQSLPYEWGFEGGLDGFRVVNNVHDTRYVNFTWHRGTHAFRFSPTNGSNATFHSTPQYLISPQFNCDHPLKVSFYYQIGDDEDLFQPAAFQMGYSTKTNAIDDFLWSDREVVTEIGWHQYVCYMPEGTKYVAVKWLPGGYFLMLDDFRFEEITHLHLADNADNTTAISEKHGRTSCSVHLDGRTLYRDGDWNTLCVPFTLNSFSDTPLDGFVAKELDTENSSNGHITGLENGTLFLNFKDATTILPGRPYIVKYVRVAGADASHLTYFAQRGSDAQSGFDYFNLVDGNPETKWYTHYYEQTDDRWFCDFTTSNPLSITGYTLIPGSGMQDNPDRAPKTWTLKAKANESDAWTIIDIRNVSENSANAMSTNDNTPTSYAIDAAKQGNYQFFRLEVYNTGGEYVQLAELTLQGTIAPGTVADIENPVFTGVTISAAAPMPVTTTDGKVSFVGSYSPVALTPDDDSNLFLGTNNTLFWPNASNNADGNYYVNACRAYFHVDPSTSVREFKLNFGDGEASGISLTPGPSPKGEWSGYYSLDGRNVGAGPVPARLPKGIYIHNGRKVVIK